MNVKHPLYVTWAKIKQRCENVNHRSYHRYGGRGIKRCDKWNDFQAFVKDIELECGPKPSINHSLDRINNDRGYEPGNVRWATQKEQMRNSRSPRYVTVLGMTKNLTEWAEFLSIRRTTLMMNINRNREKFSIEDIILKLIKNG